MPGRAVGILPACQLHVASARACGFGMRRMSIKLCAVVCTALVESAHAVIILTCFGCNKHTRVTRFRPRLSWQSTERFQPGYQPQCQCQCGGGPPVECCSCDARAFMCLRMACCTGFSWVCYGESDRGPALPRNANSTTRSRIGTNQR